MTSLGHTAERYGYAYLLQIGHSSIQKLTPPGCVWLVRVTRADYSCAAEIRECTTTRDMLTEIQTQTQAHIDMHTCIAGKLQKRIAGKC